VPGRAAKNVSTPHVDLIEVEVLKIDNWEMQNAK